MSKAKLHLTIDGETWLKVDKHIAKTRGRKKKRLHKKLMKQFVVKAITTKVRARLEEE